MLRFMGRKTRGISGMEASMSKVQSRVYECPIEQ